MHPFGAELNMKKSINVVLETWTSFENLEFKFGIVNHEFLIQIRCLGGLELQITSLDLEFQN